MYPHGNGDVTHVYCVSSKVMLVVYTGCTSTVCTSTYLSCMNYEFN